MNVRSIKIFFLALQIVKVMLLWLLIATLKPHESSRSRPMNFASIYRANSSRGKSSTVKLLRIICNATHAYCGASLVHLERQLERGSCCSRELFYGFRKNVFKIYANSLENLFFLKQQLLYATNF